MTEREIFIAALQIDEPADRLAHVRKVCGADEELRQRVEHLLKTYEQAGSYLEAPTPVLAATMAEPILERPGSIIGPYKLLQEIGEGGMGTVFMAEQSHPVQRKVAIKIIKPGMDSRQVVARFEAERQALAMMDHPNIAKVLDAGTVGVHASACPPSPDAADSDTLKRELQLGRPYFVMELVKGIPITKYCDDNHLTPRERVELFIPVCHAVQHAHQKGIIHRDIKPSNVLVALYDGRPVPKVIDFGVAKATSQKLTERTMFTQYGQIIGTLEYMSPEQADLNQLDIDTRSDIYSLGVLLYELLTGTTPFERKRLREAAFDELLRIIREEEPPKPSTRLSTTAELPSIAANRKTEPRKLSGLVRGELDWIVMKALEKDRSRRYETANGFAMDVQRYLADEAVQACPPSAGYRLRKFVRRNKGPVLAASLLALALVGGVVGTSLGLLRARQAEQRAHQEAEAARQARDSEAEQRSVAETQKRKAEQAEAETLADYRASTDDVIEQLIGSKPELGPQEKSYLEKTLKRWQAFADRKGDDERSRAIRAEGHYRVARLWDRIGRHDEARSAYESALDLTKKLVEQCPTETKYQPALARTHNNLAICLRDLGKWNEALAEYEQSRDLTQKLADQFPALPEYQIELGVAQHNLAILQIRLGQPEKARTELEQARDIQKKMAEHFPARSDYQYELGNTQHSLGALYMELGQPEEARTEFEQARDIQTKLVEQFPAMAKYRHDLASTCNTLGSLLNRLGEREAARTEIERARDLWKDLAEQFPAVPKYRVGLAGSYGNYGTLVRASGNPADSLDWFDKSVETLSPLQDADTDAKEFLRNSYWARARTYDLLEKCAEAVKDWDKAIELSTLETRPRLRALRVTSQLRAGLVADAIAELEELTRASTWNADQWYDFACVYAVASGKIVDKQQEYADRATHLLQKAVNAGFKDVAHMAKDSDLDLLRGREDFERLVAELKAKNKESGPMNHATEKKRMPD